MAILKGEINKADADARGELPPINPATGEPYFEIGPEGWGDGWNAGGRADWRAAAPGRYAGSAHVDLGGRDRTYDRAEAAVRTLEGMGYTHTGGREWKPPLGQRPAWIDAGVYLTSYPGRVEDLGRYERARGFISTGEARIVYECPDEIDRFPETPAEIDERPAPAELPAAAEAALTLDDVPCTYCSARHFFKMHGGGRICGTCGTRSNAAGVPF